MGKGFKSGKMELSMKDNGSITKPMVRVSSIMLMGTFLMGNGRKIKQTDLGFMCI